MSNEKRVEPEFVISQTDFSNNQCSGLQTAGPLHAGKGFPGVHGTSSPTTQHRIFPSDLCKKSLWGDSEPAGVAGS